MLSVLWRCWLGGRKGIRPVKNWVIRCWHAWLSVWSEMQTCIWPSWCHCHSLSLASVKSRLMLPFWYRLTRLVLEKGPLNGCVRYFFRLVSVLTLFWCSDEGVALATRKTAHQLSHERAELRYQSRIPAWQRQQQQQEQEQESVTSSGAEQEAIVSTIARLGRQRCNIVRRCAYVPRH